MKLTPMLRYNAYAKKFEKQLLDITEEVLKSVSYWTKSKFHKHGIKTEDGINEELHTTFKTLIKRWQITDEMAEKLSMAQMHRLYKYVIGQYKSVNNYHKRFSKHVRLVYKASVQQYISLIKSIPQEILRRHEEAVYRAISKGDGKNLEEEMKRIGKLSRYRAITIARDQTAKAIESLNRAEQQSLGIEYYIWQTAQDERVSNGKGGHKQLNGKIFRYDKAEAVIDTYGTKGHPAERVNCRCTARGVYLEPNERIIKAKDGIGYIIKK